MSKKNKKPTSSLHAGASAASSPNRPRSRKSQKGLTDQELTEDEEFSLRSMIKQQLSQYIRHTKIQEDLTESLTTIVQEYLSCFVLLGYTFDGTPVTTISVENQQDADAIGTMIHRFIAQSQRVGPPPGPYPGDPGEPPMYE